MASADRYRRAEVLDAMEAAGVSWPMDWRASGSGMDGSADVRAFQRLLHMGRLVMAENLSLASAIAKSTMRRDSNGNPALDKANSRGRIDVLSAAVIAAGLAEHAFDRPSRRKSPRFFVAGAA